MVALPFNPEPSTRGSEPLVWVLHDGKAGMASQALGLAEATGFPFVERRLDVHPPWTWLVPQMWLAPLQAVSEGGLKLSPPWPDLVIGCGRNTAMPALAIKRASGGRTVAAQVQDPGVGHGQFDLMLVPAHDRYRGANAFVTIGALHRVSPARLAAEAKRFPALASLPRPITAVLIGGSNRAYRLTPERLGAIAGAIAEAVRATGGSVVVTPSRRTGDEGIAILRDRLGGIPGEVWDGNGENPYFAYLAIADAILATADSVSMVSEAAATGKPVHVIDLDPNGAGDRKFAAFHAAMRERGITRPFTGTFERWSYTPLDDNARAGAAVQSLVSDRLARQRAA